MNKLEIVGLIASCLVVVSMSFKTTTFKGTITMRVLNLLGSIFFIVYGLLLPAYATAITNTCAFVLNSVYLYVEFRDHKEGNNV